MAAGGRGLAQHIAQILVIGTQQPVEVGVVALAQLPGPQHGDIHPMPTRAGNGAWIRRLTGMPVAGPRGIDLHPSCERRGVDARAQGAFS